MDVAPALYEWHEFYILVGTAGATLVALLFVAVSLGAGFLSNQVDMLLRRANTC